MDLDWPLGVSGPESDRQPNESSGAEEQVEPVRPDAVPETRFPAP